MINVINFLSKKDLLIFQINDFLSESTKLTAPGSIPELAMRRCELEQDTLRIFCFTVGPQQLIRCGVSAWQKAFKQNLKKDAMRWGGWTEAECFIRTHEWTNRLDKFI